MTLSLAIALGLALTACGGDSTSTPTPIPPAPIPSPPTIPTPPTTALNGMIIDGYISGATVFLDKNRNLALDDGEPSTLSDDEGAYSLSLTEADIKALPTSPLVALVTEGAEDIDTGEEFTKDNDFVLTALPILDFDAEKSESFYQAISPFTTQLHDQVKDTLALVVSGDLNTASLTIAINAAKSTVLGKTAAKLEIEADKLKDRLFNVTDLRTHLAKLIPSC